MSETNGLSLCLFLVDIFKKHAEAVFKKEYELDGKDGKKNYMPQTIFGCRVRAFIGILEIMRLAFPEMYKVLALSIACHRQKTHGEDKSKTITKISRSLSAQTVEKVTTSSFWMA